MVFFSLTMTLFLLIDFYSVLLIHKSTGYRIEFWIFLVCTPIYFLMGIVSLKSLNRFIKKIKNEHDITFREREAERKVQKFLRDNLTEDYHVFENIFTGYGDIDAIVVGPTGIFMIEIKSNEGLIATNEKGYLSIIEGNTPHKNYRMQAIKELSQVKKYIDNNMPGFHTWINPVLAFPFGDVIKELSLDSGHDNFEIPVLNEKDLLKYIYLNNQHPLTHEQIEKVAKVIGEWQKD